MIGVPKKTAMSHQIDVVLVNDDALEAPSLSQFISFLKPLAEHLQVNKELCIKVVDQAESCYLNSRFRGKDKATNVLSFASELPEFVDSNHLGDLAICSDVVVQEALDQNKKVIDHWAHLTIHGCLHLLGYDHIDDDEALVMEALEVALLSKLSIGNPYR